MRLDKFLSKALGSTRSEATRLLKRAEVTVNGEVKKSGAIKLTPDCQVEWQGRLLEEQGPRYIMLHKPQGYVCSHEDGSNQTAFMLLDELKPENLHFAGRLDVDTTGLVLITDDGQWSHRITSPKHKCPKRYRVWLAEPVQSDYVEQFAQGISLKSESEPTRPAQLEVIEPQQVLLTISEGKYHQVKRMFAALGNRVEALHREQIGEVSLDASLQEGEYRYLTEQEVLALS
jgi:16S rRNA pseudouridine516 synthase